MRGSKIGKIDAFEEGLATKKNRYTEEQITFVLRQVGMSTPVEEVACKFGVSEAGEAERRHRRSKDSASDRAQTIADNLTRESLAIVIRYGNRSTTRR